jgi:hypothetical protein
LKKLLITASSILFIGCATPPPAPEYLILRAEKNSPVTQTAFIVNKFRTPENALARSKKRESRPLGWKLSEEEKSQPFEVDANIKQIQRIDEPDTKPFLVGSHRQLHYSANYVEVKPGMYKVYVTCLINNKFANLEIMVMTMAGKSTYVKCEVPSMDANTVRATALEIKDTDANIRNFEFSYK